ncbi:glycine cleavage system aminomethyltransferase GcvT [Prosthecochloris sp. N3]|uniref:Aminomethyltransferase n=1 Tax=Prosthecochloris ethylica TaxID=2743976 RepID=A0ABR9XUI6_9CHLB|nr:glycine cleavage system aminomethyltransferase GcvT [Prosthecochloris ethylica]MBF0585644.1 glycine cleavage system aminomethyltransferase GcvT [Prosthecochloris ethylica]MBF0637722.1 glycine cleavage system aminomethyltransferase GcvT [Prosthecochloris ethylica]NUK46853.1 glycine cleavage system aminomethyltransferase GcvT [Prosthecochloris ethylica]
MKTTALSAWHTSAGAKMIDFGGYLMPVQYKGIIAEHTCVRSSAGLFDVSHMGNFTVTGDRAEQFLQYMTTNDVTRLSDGEAQYTLMLYPDGGIVDDLIIYRISRDSWFMVVNASNMEKDFNWLEEHLGAFDGVRLENHTDELSLIALQGPRAFAVLERVLPGETCAGLKPFEFARTTFNGEDVLVAATGYTGEQGVEISVPNPVAEALWTALMDAGAEEGIQPIGLGARDTLRLEMGYPLYGHEINRDTNPIETRLKWVTRLEKEDFIGRAACQQVYSSPQRTVAGVLMQERAIPRQGFTVYNADREPVGSVCSGTMSPTLKKPIATVDIRRDCMAPGTEVQLEVRGRWFRGEVVRLPFVARS